MEKKFEERLYVRKAKDGSLTGIMYPLTTDGNAIDTDRPMEVPLQMHMYKCIGENNVFEIYELKKAYKVH
jgi:hypothetical protein